jgi:hypothetical protein
MKPIQIIAQDLFDKVRSRFSNLEMGDEAGAVTIDPAEARFFDFDFISEGNDLGRVSISLNDLGSLKIYYSQGITENQDDPAKKIWYSFLKEMRYFAMRRLLRFDTRDIAKTNLDKNDFQHLAATQGPKEEPTMNMNETKKIRKGVSENTGRELTNTPRDQFILRMSPSVDNNALLQKVGKVVNSPEFNSDTILQIVDSPNITHPVGRYIQKEFDELQYDLGRAYEDRPEEVAEKLLSMLKGRTQQGLAEGRWNEKSSKKTSRAVKGNTEVIVRHANPVDEEYAGSRSQKKNIKAIFIQNADGERFKYPFIHPAGAFAMAQHVDHGGAPHDPAGKAIIKMSENIAQLQEFQRKIQRTSLHDDATGITERAVGRLQELKAQIEALGKRHHYEAWAEGLGAQAPIDDDIMELDAVTMEEYKQKFTQSTFQEELAGFFPLLHSIMRETNKVDLDDYVREEAVDEEEDDDTVKENAFDAFENWADATEQGKLTDDQVRELKQALTDLPEGQLDLDTAYSFFNEFGIDDDDLADKFQQAKALDNTADPIQIFQLWAKESYPELLVALGMSGTQAPAEPSPKQPTAESVEDRTSYQVAKVLADKGITYDPAKEGELVKAIGMVLVKELNMSPNQARSLINSEDFLGDTMGELQHMAQGENTDMTPPPGTMEEDKGSMVQEVAKIVKSFYNRDNPAVGPFRGEEGIVIDVEKQISEKFGEQAGQQAGKMAEAFMQKLTQEWQQKHGRVANGHGDDGLARLKELVGNIKSKVEGIGDQGPVDKNIMSAEEKDDWHPSKHVTDPQKKKELAPHDKDVQRSSYKDRADYLTKGGVPRSESAEMESILKLAGLAK